MDGTASSDWFTHPEDPAHARYEALRAVLHEGEPAVDVAARFGIPYGTLRNHIRDFRRMLARGVTPPFFGCFNEAGRRRATMTSGVRPRRMPASCRSRRARGIARAWRACSSSGPCSRGCGSTGW